MLKASSLDNKWFYTELPLPIKLIFLTYVRGDLLVLLPFVILHAILAWISPSWAVILYGVYVAVRQLGEVIYWLLQQFHTTRYRPADFGFKKLDNNALYILYQTISIVGVCYGLSLILFGLSLK